MGKIFISWNLLGYKKDHIKSKLNQGSVEPLKIIVELQRKFEKETDRGGITMQSFL